MGDFKKLKVWQKAHPMAVSIHKATGNIRASQHTHFETQLVRAAFSVPANIVEGSGRQSQREFCRFLRIALNSANECEYHLIAARDTDALGTDEAVVLIDQVVEVRKMLFGLIEAIKNNQNQLFPLETHASPTGSSPLWYGSLAALVAVDTSIRKPG